MGLLLADENLSEALHINYVCHDCGGGAANLLGVTLEANNRETQPVS